MSRSVRHPPLVVLLGCKLGHKEKPRVNPPVLHPIELIERRSPKNDERGRMSHIFRLRRRIFVLCRPRGEA